MIALELFLALLISMMVGVVIGLASKEVQP